MHVQVHIKIEVVEHHLITNSYTHFNLNLVSIPHLGLHLVSGNTVLRINVFM